MNQNAPTKEKPKPNQKRKTTNKFNLHQMSNKYQGADVHSWVDQKKRETQTFFRWIQALTSHSFQSSTTIFQPAKSTFRCWDRRKAINPSPDQGKFLILTQSTFSTPYFSTGKIIRKCVVFNAAQDFYHMKNWEKKEINISTRENIPKLLTTIKGHSRFLNGLNTSRKKTLINRFRGSHHSNLLNRVKTSL